jgi:hypothetical protein
MENSAELYTIICFSFLANNSWELMVHTRKTIPQTIPSASGMSLDSLADPLLPRSLPHKPLFKVYCAKIGISWSVNRNPAADIAADHTTTCQVSALSKWAKHQAEGTSGSTASR